MMMDSAHVQPFTAGNPMALRRSWKPTMMVETNHFNGSMIVSKKSMRYPYSSDFSAAYSVILQPSG
jgi:hypothetical protein